MILTRKMSFKPALRLDLPGYPFAELEKQAVKIRASGKPLYDLSIGDPDLMPPDFLTQAIHSSLDEEKAHLYPSSQGDPVVRRSVARWFKGRFNVVVDPETQICILMGAKEGLAQLARAVVNPGDEVGVPDVGYPVYLRSGCRLVEGIPRKLHMDPQNGFLPDLEEARGVKLLFLNYPNNPTGAVATDEFLTSLAKFIEDDPQMTVAFDMAYGEFSFNHPARSLLEFTPNAVEFHSLSKMANATGYRVGFAIGDPERISALIRAKQEVDSGTPLPYQRGLAAVLDRYDGCNPPPDICESREIYRQRRECLIKAVDQLGMTVFRSDATFYVWFKVGTDEMPFISAALDQGVLFTPGSGFGSGGKGWVRASVTTSDDSIDGAIDAIKRMS